MPDAPSSSYARICVNLANRLRALLTPQNATEVFVKMMLPIAVIAVLAHLSFILLFDSAGVVPLVRLNVLSVLLFALTIPLVQHGRARLALILMGTEIVLHGTVAVYLIGWDSGFHFYIILIVPVGVLSTLYRGWVKAVVVSLAGLYYIGLDVVFRGALPQMPLAPHILQGLHYFNLASTLLILALLALMYYLLVTDADTRLREQACTDPLTQLRNRRFAMEVAQHEAAVFQRDGRPLALVIGDVDHFKHVNDHHGHETGDLALKAVAGALRDGVREVDHVARWGGEEFLMLLPGTAEDEAVAVADRLRQAVASLRLVHQGREASLSITLGVSILADGESVEQALARADKALYRGKQSGRNRVVLADASSSSAQA
jgi:diguanylate cyclase (GGDEF)-like protein